MRMPSLCDDFRAGAIVSNVDPTPNGSADVTMTRATLRSHLARLSGSLKNLHTCSFVRPTTICDCNRTVGLLRGSQVEWLQHRRSGPPVRLACLSGPVLCWR